MSPSNPVGDLVALTERLSNLLAEENTLLAASRTRDVAGLQADKAKLATAFESQIARIGRQRGLLDEIEPNLKRKLSRVMARAKAMIAENARALRAARDTNQKLLNAIVNAVTERNGKLDVYTATGGRSASLYGARPIAQAVSLSIDQRL